MTKKDYDVIAACIGAALADGKNDKQTVHDVATRLTNELGLENPRFDAGKFFTRVEYWRKCHSGEDTLLFAAPFSPVIPKGQGND